MNKRILLIGYNYYPEPTGIGKYSGEMIAWMAQKGYECEVLTTYPYYPQWQVQSQYLNKRFWFSTECQQIAGRFIKIHRCPMYVPSHPSGFKRVLLDLSFCLTAFLKLTQLLSERRFDYVITVVPCFQLGLLGVFYKRLRKSVLLYHIQDMQIEAARDLKMIRSQFAIKALFRLEKYILKQADVISSVSEGMVRKIKEKAPKEIYLFPNWADTKQFFPLQNRGESKKLFGFHPSDKIILYAGAIGEKQGLEAILYAAEYLKVYKHLKFVICGSGPYKQKLSSLSVKLGLNNVVFFPLQPLDRFNLFLNVADIHLILQKSNASDLVMPSKLTTILAVGGLALVTAHKQTSLYTCINQYNVGLLVEPENQLALNEAIWKATTENHDKIRLNARRYAEKYLSIEKIMREFENVLLGKQTLHQAKVSLKHERLLSGGEY